MRLLSNPRHFETFDLIYRSLCALLYNFVPMSGHPGGSISSGRFVSGLIYNTCDIEVLLRAVAEDATQPVSRLALLTAAEKQRLLVEWNRTAVDHRPEATIHELFREQAAQRPGATALLLGERQMSYAELDSRSNQLARYLRGLGIGPDVPVGLCLERSFESVVALLGILKAGGAYLPLEHNYPKDRLAFMLEDAGAPLIGLPLQAPQSYPA